MMARHQQPTVLFLCTGNYYRSRFAEILFNSVAGKMGLPWKASSKGLALERGVNNVGPMAVSAVTALEAMGVSAADAVARILDGGERQESPPTEAPEPLAAREPTRKPKSANVGRETAGPSG